MTLTRRRWMVGITVGSGVPLLTSALAKGQSIGGGVLGAGIFSSAVLSRDGKRLLTASHDHAARLWNLDTGELIRGYLGHNEAVRAVAFNKDEARIVTGSGRETDMASVSMDNSIRVWETNTGRELHQLLGHRSFVYSAEFSPDGRLLLSSARDSTARIWSLELGRELHQFRGLGFLQPAAFSPNGRQVLMIENTNNPYAIRLWSAENGRNVVSLKGHAGKVESACFSPDGLSILTASRDSTARIWNAETGQQTRSFSGRQGSPMKNATFSADGSTILTAANNRVELWRTDSHTPYRQLNHDGKVIHAVWNVRGNRILTKWQIGERNTVSLWDADKGETIKRWLLPMIYGRDVAMFSPDGSSVLLTLERTTLVDAVTGKTTREF